MDGARLIPSNSYIPTCLKSPMNWKLLTLPALLLSAGFIATTTGCEVTTCESDCVNLGGNSGVDPGTGGSANGTGGKSSSSGGTGAGEGGMGGMAAALDCSAAPLGDGGSCEPDPDATGDSLACQQCIEAKCCVEQETCYAQGPDTACAFGSVLYNGSVDSEIGCMLSCLTDREADGDFLGVQDDIDACAAQCSAQECSSTEATVPAQDFAACVAGVKNLDAGCQTECGIVEPIP